MALCNSCVFMNKKYDEFRQNYDDTIVEGENIIHHFCPIYNDHIPNEIYYDNADCEYYFKKV